MKRFILNCLIVSYLAVIYFAGVPESNTLNSRIKQKAEAVAFAIGIWPSWSMFAPNPVRFDSKTFVRITYKNGDVKELNVENETKGLLATFRKARWMKYAQDNLRNPQQAGLWHPALRHFHAKHASENNPIIELKLVRKWAELEAVNEGGPLPPIWKTPRLIKTEDVVVQKY